MTTFPHLFSPLAVGHLVLPNRIMMGSMHTSLEARDDGIERLAAFYAERARGGAALMVTGGFAPNAQGRLGEEPIVFDEARAVSHRAITQAVHRDGGRILLQILHSGRYGMHGDIVAPSPIRSPINRATPRALEPDEIERTIEDFVLTAVHARAAGYDGVEIMGSEGYLITQFLSLRTNHRDDDWGGSLDNRMRFAVEIVRRTRAAVGSDFIVMFRLSVLDLVEGGLAPDETIALGRALEAAGTDIFDTGIGWHEARVPTIAAVVPRGAFVDAVSRIGKALTGPIVATNRINTPELAERILADGHAAMVSLARPFLADSQFAAKARNGRSDAINTCIACNQACLDHYFVGKVATCLVNPRAGHETEIVVSPATEPKRIAVIGAGAAGLAAAVTAAERGHSVTIWEAAGEIGGQLNLARAVPAKEEFNETLRYFRTRIAELGIDLKLGRRAGVEDVAGSADAVILATGVEPRTGVLDGEAHPKVATYTEILSGRVVAGRRVAIVGAGGIGFDVAVYLAQAGSIAHADPAAFRAHWGIGGKPERVRAVHEITMLQRSPGPMGRTLGRTTGWVHKLELHQAGVRQVSGVTYRKVDDAGLHYSVDGKDSVLDVDTVILCAGQVPVDGLADAVKAAGLPLHVIGGARLAAELDAKRAIEEGMRAAIAL